MEMNTKMHEAQSRQQTDMEALLSQIGREEISVDAGQYSPLVLAYIGDAAYELVIRTHIVSEANMQVNKMHKKTIQFVKAETQAKMMMAIEEVLTPQEHAIYKRGRNAKAATMAKNATMKDYRMATGFEALIGFLYLNRDLARMMDLIEMGLHEIKAYEIKGSGTKPHEHETEVCEIKSGETKPHEHEAEVCEIKSGETKLYEHKTEVHEIKSHEIKSSRTERMEMERNGGKTDEV